MERFTRSWALAKQSFRVLRSNPQLALFPLISGVASLVVLASFAIPLYIAFGGLPEEAIEQQARTPMAYVLMFAFYAVSYFVVVFFNCGLVWCAHEHLQGRTCTFGDGMRMAAKNLPQIILWSLIASTVGTILKIIEERVGIIGQIVVNLIGLVWSLATFFVVPLLIVEKSTATAALKRSAGMLKKTWGEQIIGNLGIGVATSVLFLLGLIPLFFGIAIGVAGGSIALMIMGIALAVIYWIAVAILSSALSGIFQTALFMFASSGQRVGAFSPEFFDEAFRHKEKRNWLG